MGMGSGILAGTQINLMPWSDSVPTPLTAWNARSLLSNSVPVQRQEHHLSGTWLGHDKHVLFIPQGPCSTCQYWFRCLQLRGLVTPVSMLSGGIIITTADPPAPVHLHLTDQHPAYSSVAQLREWDQDWMSSRLCCHFGLANVIHGFQTGPGALSDLFHPPTVAGLPDSHYDNSTGAVYLTPIRI